MAGIDGRYLQHALVTFQATCEATGSTFTFEYFKDLEYEDGADKKPVHDKNGKQRGYTIDKQKTDGKFTTLLPEWFSFRAWLRQQAQAISAQTQQTIGAGQVEFDLTVTYGNTIATRQTDQLATVLVQKEAKKSSDNQEALECEVPLFIVEISDDQGNHFVEFGS